MNYFIYFNELGRIFAQTIGEANYPDLISLEIGEIPIQITSCYVENNQVVLLPNKPDENNYWEFDYQNKIWVGNVDMASTQVLAKRLPLLQQSDWTQIPGNPLIAEQQQAWAVYRQQLRDITSQSGYPFNVIWPTPPT
jgi:hypothetical protein